MPVVSVPQAFNEDELYVDLRSRPHPFRHLSRAAASDMAAHPGRSTTGNGVMDMSWRYRAACRAAEPDLFFPIGTGQAALDQLAEAKSICRGCPVVNECLAWALETGQNSGVWGGMSEDERRWLRRDTRSWSRGARAVRPHLCCARRQDCHCSR